MLCGCVSQRSHSGDGYELVSTMCTFDLRKGDLFVPSWARVRRLGRRSVQPELLMGGGGVRSILFLLLLLLVARCLETIYVCIWRMLAFMSVAMDVWWSVEMFAVYRALLKIVGFLSLGVVKYVVCLEDLLQEQVDSSIYTNSQS